MSKTKLILILVLAVALVATFSIMPGCTTSQAATDKTVAESASGYALYEQLREYAKANKEWPEKLAADYSLAFTNIMGGIPFCESVWQNVQDQWKFAGGDPNKLYYADNQYDATMGLQNADILLAKKPDVFINFQFDSKVNSIISNKFGAANIPIIAVDVPTPGAPFMGVNNFQVAYMAGEKAIELVEAAGGIDTIDKIILMQMPSGGEVVMLRSEGFYQAFADKYGADKIDPMTIRGDGGAGEAEQANQALTDILSANPDIENAVMTSVNEQTMSGCIAAVQTAGRWDPEKWIVVTQGCDETGQQQLKDGLTDASVAYFPEKYGEYLIPASVALMNGALVPPFMYVENEVITVDNIDQFYPAK